MLYRRFTGLANFNLFHSGCSSRGFLLVKDLHAASFAYRAYIPAAGRQFSN
jgi:hypothetical protein